MTGSAVLELTNVTKAFGGVTALQDVSVSVRAGEVTCFLGDNGAGKSTLIKLMSGVYQPSSGGITVDGRRAVLSSPRAAQAIGISTVHQDDGNLPLMSVTRNFFLGREPTKGWGPTRRIDTSKAAAIALQEIAAMGVTRVTDPNLPVGALSGGERQALAISRALYFGARVLILDEPTSALGVREAGVVLRLIQQAKSRGIAVVFITHNAHHAMSVGDRFAILIQSRVAEQFSRGERSREEMLNLMAGGRELESLQSALEEMDQAERTASAEGRS